MLPTCRLPLPAVMSFVLIATALAACTPTPGTTHGTAAASPGTPAADTSAAERGEAATKEGLSAAAVHREEDALAVTLPQWRRAAFRPPR